MKMKCTGVILLLSLSQPSGEPPPWATTTPSQHTHTSSFLQPWHFAPLQVAWQAIVLISPSPVSPFPGELYGRDSKNSCSTKNWCHSLTTPQCFQRDGRKLQPADGPLNRPTPRRGSTEQQLVRTRQFFLFTHSFCVPAWVNVNSKCETFNAVVNVKCSQEITGTNVEHGKQEYPEGNVFTGRLHKILKPKFKDQMHYKQ